MRPSFVSPRRKEGPPCIWDTHGKSGNVFANPHASSSAPYPQELNHWNSSIEEPLRSSTVEKSERREQNQDLRCQSGPSAKDAVIFSGGDSSKNNGADQQRLQISDLHFDKFPTPATFACWKISFKTEVCTCSQFPTEAMQWIKEWCKELARCWKRRVRAAERSVAHLGRFQANLESEVPVASLMWLTCMISHLFHFRFTDADQYSLRPPPTVINWWPIG